MATVKFTLREPSATAPTPVYLVFRFQNDKLKHSTGLSVNPRFWNAEKQRVKNTSNVPDRDALNNLLNELEAETMRFYTESMAARNFTMPALKAYLLEFQGKAPKDAPTNFFGFFRAFIEASDGRVQLSGEAITPGTIAKYRSTLALLEAFAAQSKRPLDFPTIDLEFYADFTKYLSTRPHRKGNGYTANAIGKHVQVIKTVLNEATEKGHPTTPAYRSPKFRAIKEDSDNVYLSENELETLLKFDFSGKPSLERVRDLFLVGCWTGLRFSDLSALNPDKHIVGDFIEIEQFKTGGKVVIPLHPVVSVMLAKYGGNLPPAISNQKFNDYIKEVCRMAGICERVQKGETRGGQRYTLFLEKWEMVSTHTARRSFATNLYKSGYSSIGIRQITGHRTEKAFMKYIKATPHEHANLLKAHWERRGQQPDGEAAKLKIV